MATISKEVVRSQNFYKNNGFLKGIIDASNGTSYAFKVVNGRCLKLAILFYSSLIKKVGKDKDIFIPTKKVTDIKLIGDNVVTFKNERGLLDCGFMSLEKKVQYIERNSQTNKYEKSEKDFANSSSAGSDFPFTQSARRLDISVMLSGITATNVHRPFG